MRPRLSLMIQIISTDISPRTSFHKRTNRSSYPNLPVRIFYALAVILLPPLLIVSAIPLGVVQFWGWLGAILAVIFIMILCFVATSFYAFTTIELTHGLVVLRSPLWRRKLKAEDVERVELSPPVNTLNMDWSLWRRTSQCIVHRRGSRPINLSFMPDGLKRRIAQTLDPTNWPPLPETE